MNLDARKFGVEGLDDRALLSITAETGATISPVENAAFSGPVATFTSPDNGPFTAVINWGDGSSSSVNGTSITGGPSPATFTINGSHTYSDERAASNLVTTITDTSDSTTATATGLASASEDDTLLPLGSVNISATEGSTFSGAMATFSDTTYPANSATDFSATINWGDGTSSAGTVASTTPGTLTVSGSHAYAAAGTHQATVTVADDTPGTASATATATATVAVSGLSIAESVPATATVGGAVTETITITNTGSTAATAVAFSDALGTSGYDFLSAFDLLGTAFSYNSATGKLTGTIGTLVASGTDTVTMRLIPTAAGNFSDAASVTANGVTATTTASSTVSAGTTPANVSVTKSASTSGTVGTTLSDTITLTNAAGTATTAGGVTLFDMLGPGQSYLAAKDTVGSAFSFDPTTNTLIGSTSSIPASGTDTVTIYWSPTAAGTITDTAYVAVAEGNSATTITATGSTTVAAVPGTKVIVANSAPVAAIIGSIVTDTVTITNVSASPLTNVAFGDNFGLPSPGLGSDAALLSASDTAGSTFTLDLAGNGSVSGTIASLAPSGTPGSVDTVTVTYVPLMLSGVSNTASIGVPGGNGGPYTSSAFTTTDAAPSPSPNITIAESAPASAPIGSLRTATVTLTNNTVPAAAATNVAFIDDLPGSNQTIVSASDTGSNKFTFANGLLSGTIANLGTGASNTDTITIVSLVTGQPGTATGDAAYIGVPGGNQAAPFAGSSTAIYAGTANVSVAQSAPATGTVGTPVTDTVTLGNSGTSPVTNVAFIDLLPGNVSSVSASDAAGDHFTFANGQITGTLASVSTGTSTVTVVYIPTAAGDDDDTAVIGIAAGNTGTSSATASTTVAPIDPNSIYVTAVYRDVLDRAPDPAGLQFWTNFLDKAQQAGDLSAALSSVALGFDQSAEYYQNFVVMPDYSRLLGRAADAAGLQYWTAQLQNGLTDQKLEASLISSAEFYNAAGGTDSDWATAVYKLLLGRAPDQGGLTYWTNQLATLEGQGETSAQARSQVALQIANSQENNTDLINQDYFHYLGRAADPSGLQYWLSQFANGATNEDVIAGFTGSAEYYQEKTGVEVG